jgi:hypothetical protein
MVSLRQVAQTVAQLAASACYPNGISQPSITGALVRTAADDPRSVELDADLAAGGTFVRVLPQQGVSRPAAVSLSGEQEVVTPAATMSATISGTVVTFSGTVTAGWPAMLVVNGIACAYAPTATDTLATVAAAMAALLAGTYPGTIAAGAMLTIPGATSIVAYFPTEGTTALALLRQTQGFAVTIFAPGPDVRDTVGNAVKLAIIQNPQLTLPDGTVGLLLFTAEYDNNQPSKELDFERVLLCQVEYDLAEVSSAWLVATAGGVLTLTEDATTWGVVGAAADVLTSSDDVLTTESSVVAVQ